MLGVGGSAGFWLPESSPEPLQPLLGLSKASWASPELLLGLSWAFAGSLPGALGRRKGGLKVCNCRKIWPVADLLLACCWLVADLLPTCCRPDADLKAAGGEVKRTFWSKMRNCRQILARSFGTPVVGGG